MKKRTKRMWRRWIWRWARATAAGLAIPLALAQGGELPTDDGYRGIWYFNQPSQDEFKYKYSGGLATYPQQHAPMAVYRAQVRRTFFVYGGTAARSSPAPQRLLHLVSYYDHATGTVPRPRILLDKQTADAHDNPTLAIDDAGYLWVFSPSHGTVRPSYLHRSVRPYAIEAFDRILTTNFSYPQAWHLPGKGFVFLHTRYGGSGLGLDAARSLGYQTSPDGFDWSPARGLAGIAQGNYQISWPHGDLLGTAFNYHPARLGLNARANLYYLRTADFAQTWTTASGARVDLPVQEADHVSRIYDSETEGTLVYLKDLAFDAAGRPVVLFLTSRGYASGPQNDPRQWKTIRWTGKSWEVRNVTASDHNYDHGSLYLEADGTWRIIAPTDPGPQPYNPGGEMVMWTSHDQGASWELTRHLTQQSKRNHTYARRPLDAHPDFYALWADGHAREPSVSCLYFTDQQGTHVWRLPFRMNAETAKPEIAG